MDKILITIYTLPINTIMRQQQRKTLIDFFTNLAVAWFTAGVIVPYFSISPAFEKIFFSIIGISGTIAFLYIALQISDSTIKNGR